MRSPIHVPTGLHPEARGCDHESLRDIRTDPSGYPGIPGLVAAAKAEVARLYHCWEELGALA